MLDEATKDFEKNFKTVLMGPAAATFKHDGQRLDYVVVCGGDHAIPEGEMMPVYDTAEDAVKDWRKSVREYEGEEFLYWRIRPEIAQDENEKTYVFDPEGQPNPTYGKWKVYSRFRAVS
jgi:hypothetical protein